MMQDTKIRRDANGAIDVKYYTGRGRTLQGIAIRDSMRVPVSRLGRLVQVVARYLLLNRPVPGSAKSP